MLWILLALLGAAVCAAALVLRMAVARNMHVWLPGWRRRRRRLGPVAGGAPVHLIVAVCDHFEPARNRPGAAVESDRVRAWTERHPPLAEQFRDADGVPARHTFFFPEEEYRPEHLDALAGIARRGCGEVEVHLHHDGDTGDGFRATLRNCVRLFGNHGLLGRDLEGGAIRYGFIHGNWALDNARPDGRWCGVNDELRALRETGCYADFTLPAAPDPCQTRKVNGLYYATDDPMRPRSHDDGVDVAVGRAPSGDLLIVQGPLTLDWRYVWKRGFPRTENAELSATNPPSPGRVPLWVAQRVHVLGRPEWIFVKLHCHGAQESDFEALLGDPMAATLEALTTRYNDGSRYAVHFATAREMVNIIKAAEAGASGDPGDFRDFVIEPPPVCG